MIPLSRNTYSTAAIGLLVLLATIYGAYTLGARNAQTATSAAVTTPIKTAADTSPKANSTTNTQFPTGPALTVSHCKNLSTDTQYDLNSCSAADVQEAQKNLDALFAKLVVQYKPLSPDAPSTSDGTAYDAQAAFGEKSLQSNFIDAQKSWLNYAKSYCTAQYYLEYGGSIAPLIQNTCTLDLINNRYKELQNFDKNYSPQSS
jgi:uncharacterized protein YecT (DUF1311 family)